MMVTKIIPIGAVMLGVGLLAVPALAQQQPSGVQGALQGLLSGNQSQDQAVRDAYERATNAAGRTKPVCSPQAGPPRVRMRTRTTGAPTAPGPTRITGRTTIRVQTTTDNGPRRLRTMPPWPDWGSRRATGRVASPT
jgi:hypothetical protein